jgi:hypothetical protein
MEDFSKVVLQYRGFAHPAQLLHPQLSKTGRKVNYMQAKEDGLFWKA